MSKLKKAFKADLVASCPVKLEFDVSSLPSNETVYVNTKKVFGGLAIGIVSVFAVFVLTVGGVIIASGLHVKNYVKTEQRNYSGNTEEVLKDDYFQSLNDVSYPSINGTSVSVDSGYSEFMDSYKGFSGNLFDQVKGNEGNVTVAAASAYANIMMLSYAYSGTDASIFDTVLGQDSASRLEGYKKLYQSNYFAIDNSGSVQMYNGSFQSSEYGVNRSYVNALTNMYGEAFKVDFSSEDGLSKIASWANEKMGDENFVTVDDLQINNPLVYFLSTFYFQSEWSHSYSTSSTSNKDFLLDDGTSISTPFMNHVYYGEAYQYDGYVAFSDHYSANGMKITYFTPNEQGGDIVSLIGDNDIFTLDESKIGKTDFIDLSVPKFDSSYTLELNSAFSSMGLSELYDSGKNSISNPFSDYSASATSFIERSFQKNSIKMDEDGTTAKSVTFSLGAGATAPATDGNTLVVSLDSTFLYVISDSNGLPLFIGKMSDPRR